MVHRSLLTENHNLKKTSLLKKPLDDLLGEIAVLDDLGNIVHVNKSWRVFSTDANTPPELNFFRQFNYLEVCDNAVGSDVETARAMASGIRDVIAGRK